MLPRAQALRAAPRMLAGGGRATYHILRAASPRAPTPARAAARDLAAAPRRAVAPRMEFDPTVTERFFNRECEIEDLIDTLSGTPQGILVLTGPQNSGKTALAREILDRWAALRSTQAEGPPSLLYLDCRAHDLGTPAELAKHMKELVTGNPGVMEQARKVLESMKLTIGQGPWSATVEDMFAPDRDVTPVASVIASYTEFLSLFEGERHRPIIYIDEANVLEAWREAGVGEPELKKLLRFFVKITKQDNRAHVVLATSSSLLEGFLRGQGLDSKQFRVEVVGDLAEDEARRYFCGGGDWPGLLMESAAVLPGGGGVWPEVWAACGGNIGLLRQCAEASKTARDWEEAVAAIMREPARAVANGLSKPAKTPGGRRKWTPAQFRAVLLLIARSPHHAVLEGTIEAALGEQGSEVLLSLVEHNLLALRPQSMLARDLPPEVFEGELGACVVMMPSPAELYKVLQMHKAGKLGGGEEAGWGGAG